MYVDSAFLFLREINSWMPCISELFVFTQDAMPSKSYGLSTPSCSKIEGPVLGFTVFPEFSATPSSLVKTTFLPFKEVVSRECEKNYIPELLGAMSHVA